MSLKLSYELNACKEQSFTHTTEVHKEKAKMRLILQLPEDLCTDGMRSLAENIEREVRFQILMGMTT